MYSLKYCIFLDVIWSLIAVFARITFTNSFHINKPSDAWKIFRLHSHLADTFNHSLRFGSALEHGFRASFRHQPLYAKFHLESKRKLFVKPFVGLQSDNGGSQQFGEHFGSSNCHFKESQQHQRNDDKSISKNQRLRAIPYAGHRTTFL